MEKENSSDLEKIHDNVYNASVNGTNYQALNELDKNIREDPYKSEDTLKIFYEHFEHHPDDLIKWCNWFTEDQIKELKNKYDYLKFKFGDKRLTFPSESTYLEAKKIDSDLIVKDEPNSHSLTIRMILANVNDDAVKTAIAKKEKEEAQKKADSTHKKKIIIGTLIAVIGVIAICAIALYATSDHPVNTINLSTDSDVMSINDQIAVKFDVNSDASDKTLRWVCDNGTITTASGNTVYVKLNKYVESGKTINITAISDKYNIKTTKTITISNENCCKSTNNAPSYISSLDDFDITANIPDVLKKEGQLSFTWSTSDPEYIEVISTSANKAHVKLNGLAQHSGFSIYYKIDEFDDVSGKIDFTVDKKSQFSITTDYPSIRPGSDFSLGVKVDGIYIEDIEWIITGENTASVDDNGICHLIDAKDGDTVTIEGKFGQLSSKVSFKVNDSAPEILHPLVSIADWSYSDESSVPTATGIKSDTVINYSYYSYSDGKSSSKAPTAVGSYRLDAVVEKTAAYYGATASCDFKITKKEISDATFDLVTNSSTYSGSEQTVPAKNVVMNGKTLTSNDYTITSNNDLIDVGVKTIYLKGTGNYTGTSDASRTFTIEKRTVILESRTVSKTYDGNALTDSNIDIKGDGFVTGEGAAYDFTGKQTYLGTSDNEFTYTLNSNTKNSNYDISTIKGTLTITADTTPIVITADSDSKVYDGSVLTDTGYTYTQNVLKGNDMLEVTVAGSITDAGSIPNTVTTYRIMHGSINVTDCYTIAPTVNGILTVEKATLKIIPYASSKEYLSSDPALSYWYSNTIISETPAFTGELKRVQGEAIGKYKITTGTLSLKDNGQFKASNYNIELKEMYFQITKRSMTVDQSTISYPLTIDDTYDRVTITNTSDNVNTGNIIIHGEGDITITLNSVKLTSSSSESAIVADVTRTLKLMVSGNVEIRGNYSSDTAGPAISCGDLNIQLNGNLNTYGSDAQLKSNSNGSDGSASIIAKDVTITGSGTFSMFGGNGANGSNGSDGNDGYSGSDAVYDHGGNSVTSYASSGSNGNNGTDGFNGGSGGAGIIAESFHNTSANAIINMNGGNGGSGGNGGKGGNGGTGGDGDNTLNHDVDGADGGNGGSGGNGGKGGNGGPGYQCSTVYGSITSAYGHGGNGGSGGNGGKGGNGGDGISSSWFVVQTPNVSCGGNGGNGGSGGNGGDGGDGSVTGSGGNAGTAGNGGNGGDSGLVTADVSGKKFYGEDGSSGSSGSEGQNGKSGQTI